MYKYDALYRLIEATGREKSGLANAFSNADMGIDFPIPHNGANSMENYTHFYAYDKLGNIMSMNSQDKWLRNYVYADESNLLLKHDPQQTIDDYAYDEHGNITRMPGIEDMQWNYADYLSKTQCGTVNTWYVYDQSGNRSRKITEKQGGIREERIYLGSYELYRKYQGAELEIERATVHIMDDKTRVAIVDRQTVENGNTVSGTVNYRYQLSNHLGSATLELDQTAQIISYEEYHPFGTTSYWSGQSESEVKKKRYRYVGKERDEETGLYYYGARYYAAWIGRFVSVDPLQHKYPHYTPYQYAGNKPITYIDLDGLEEMKKEEEIQRMPSLTNPKQTDIINEKKTNKGFKVIAEEKFIIDKFLEQLNSRTGNSYSVDENGFLYNTTGIVNTVTDENKSEFLSMLVEKVMSDSETFVFELVNNDSDVLFDNYDSAKVDVGDLERMDKEIQAGTIAHFLAERLENPKNYSKENRTKKNFDIAHLYGKVAESVVVCSMLSIPFSLVIQESDQRSFKDEEGITSYYFESTSKYGSVVYGFKQGAAIIEKERTGEIGVKTGSEMLSKFKRKK